MYRIGTCHFVSKGAAVAYYRSQGYGKPIRAVHEKLAEGLIAIGPPKIKADEQIQVNNEGRYLIVVRKG